MDEVDERKITVNATTNKNRANCTHLHSLLVTIIIIIIITEEKINGKKGMYRFSKKFHNEYVVYDISKIREDGK